MLGLFGIFIMAIEATRFTDPNCYGLLNISTTGNQHMDEIEITGYTQLNCAVLIDYAKQINSYVSIAWKPLRLIVSPYADLCNTSEKALYKSPLGENKLLQTLMLSLVDTEPFKQHELAIRAVYNALRLSSSTATTLQPFPESQRILITTQTFHGVGGLNRVGMKALESIMKVAGIMSMRIGETFDSQRVYFDVRIFSVSYTS